MALELTIDVLTVSRHEEPPAERMVGQALTAAGLGVAEYSPAPTRTEGAPATGRVRIGTYNLRSADPATTARIVVARHGLPVTTGMGDSAFAALTRGLTPDDVHTLRQGIIALDLRLTTTPERALPALVWGMRVVRTLLDLTQGVAVDIGAQRCYSRAEIGRVLANDPMAHIAIHSEIFDSDSRWLHTHGLQKFGRPELELVAVPDALNTEGDAFLREVAYSLATGTVLTAGQEIDFEGLGAVVALGTTPDMDHQAPFGRLRLADVPLPAERQGISPARLLGRMALAEANRLVDENDQTDALDTIERILAANPDDCAALALKGHLYLRAGNLEDALQIGELMELRVPEDYRGALTIGMSLASMGRFREALRALDRSVELQPEAAETFAVRAQVHEALGNDKLAAVDRAHAVYLSA